MKYLQLFISNFFISLTLTKPEPIDTININLNISYEKSDGIQRSRQKETSDHRDMASDYHKNGNNGYGYIKNRYKDIGKYNRYDAKGYEYGYEQNDYKHIVKSIRHGAKNYGDRYGKYGYDGYGVKGKCDAKWLKEYQGYRPTDKPQIDYIIGGTMVNDWKEWPWIASLNFEATKDTDDDDYVDTDYCGGVLISCQHVVTALHCLLDDSTSKIYPPENIEIRLGTTKEDKDGDGTIFTTAELFYKKDQDGNIEFLPNNEVLHDIAVIKLNRPINPYMRTDHDIRPILLPSRALKITDQYWIAGWGYIGYNYTTSKYIETEMLMQTKKILIGNATDCSRDQYFNATRNICLIMTWKNTTCKGDSGSPGMIADERGRWYLEGIESKGINPCNRENSRGIQMSVIYYKKDIEKWIAK